ncbi:MAG: Abi family protein [Actinomycetaceae bacterium]|nr:Abi family protein [Actinomycetaceae bacterium]
MPERQVKQATSVAEQIEILRARGMNVDEPQAVQWLTNVGYYRLSAYWYPARLIGDTGGRGDTLTADISFADAANLYEADRKLRTLIYDGLERIEVALRARLSAQICSEDPLRYQKREAFRQDFNHTQWLATVNKRISRAMVRSESIRHYARDYDGYYPFWVIAEVLDFSDVSRMFEGLLVQDQNAIANSLNVVPDLGALSRKQRRKTVSESPLVRWFEQLTVLRNMCAHHARVWNKSFAPASTVALRTIPELSSLPEGQSGKVCGALKVMSYLLCTISPGTVWPSRIATLMKESFFPNPMVTRTALGASADWDGVL